MTLTGLSGLPSRVTVTGNNCTSVAQGSTCQMTLTLNIYGAVGTAGDGPISVQTMGASTNASFTVTANLFVAISQWESTTLDFGNVTVNTTSATQTRRVQNVGNGTIDWNGAYPGLTGNKPAAFGVVMGGDCSSVAKNGYCTVTFSFTPAAVGAAQADSLRPWNITSTNNYLSITGNGVAGLVYDRLESATQADKDVVVSFFFRNTKSTPLLVSSRTLVNPGAGMVAPIQGASTCTPGGYVAAGAACTVVVRATPECLMGGNGYNEIGVNVVTPDGSASSPLHRVNSLVYPACTANLMAGEDDK